MKVVEVYKDIQDQQMNIVSINPFATTNIKIHPQPFRFNKRYTTGIRFRATVR